MDEFSLYVLDIAMNSVKAGASKISIELDDDGEWLTFAVTDNGCGMTEEAVEKVSTASFEDIDEKRGCGLGIPFLKRLANATGGFVKINSVHNSVSSEHGTRIMAKFGKSHTEFVPMGDMVETVKTLIQGAPDIDFEFTHRANGAEVFLSCQQMREVLGDVSLNELEILKWIGKNLKEQYFAANISL